MALYTRSFFIAFVSQTGFVMANLLMAHYARWIDFLGGSEMDIGWIMGVSAIGSLMLRPWLGQWLNRIGARNMWAVGYALFLAGSMGNLLIFDLNWPIYLLRMSLVLGVACASISSLTYICQTTPPGRQTEAIGTLGVAGFVGFILGPYLGDLILGSGERTRESFMSLFLTTGALLALPTVLLCYLSPTKAEHRSTSVRLIDFKRDVVRYWPGSILAVMFMFGVCMTVPLVFFSRFVDAANLQIPGVSEVGLFFLCYALIGLTLRLVLRRVPDRFGRRKVLIAGMLFMSTGMFSFLLVGKSDPWWLIAPGLLCGAGHGLMFHTGTALVLASFPDHVRGTGSALSFMMLDLGMLVGAPLLGAIAGLFGYGWLFASVGGFCLLVCTIYITTL